MEMATRAFVLVLHLRSGLAALSSSKGGRFATCVGLGTSIGRLFLVPHSLFFRTLKCFSNCNVKKIVKTRDSVECLIVGDGPLATLCRGETIPGV